jgi:hypothetical protein
MHEICGKLHRPIRFYRYEFTVPSDLQSKVGFGGLSELDKMAEETFIEWLGGLVLWLREPKSVKLGIIHVPQWWHTEDPFGLEKFGGFYPHLHGVCFDFGWDGERVLPMTKLYNAYDPGFVRLRALWRSNLEARYGKSRARDVDAYVRYEEGGDELRHRLEYMLRSPVKDLYEFVQLHGVPAEYDAAWVRQMLRGRGHAQRVHYYGWLAPVVQSPNSPFMRFLGLKLLNRKSYDVERKKVHCPNCDCLMEPVRYAVEDTDALIARGERFVVHVPPWLVSEYGGG